MLKKSVTLSETEVVEVDLPLPVGFTARIISSALFSGYFPYAQGTVGSFWGPVIFFALPFRDINAFSNISVFIAFFTLILYFLGVWASNIAEKYWGHDAGRIVIDEVVGMFVTLLFTPLNLATVWTGFFLFRFFDIAKPQPVKWAEKLPGGWGVMTDDLFAGIYANLTLKIMILIMTVLK